MNKKRVKKPIQDRKVLYEELRLIEKRESEVNGAWKGAHLLLFFLAFVFGSFCTFCFHMLMYLFDENCVLYPKLLTLTPTRYNVIHELIPDDSQMLPVDFVSTQWIEKSACYLPTYVPLVSGIFGLVWTTMFIMCSTGSRTLTGLQRPWRVIPPVFIFSLAMGCLCIYTSTITHRGLEELCNKFGEITGSSTCSYTINVASLLYERKIRGVYQAICLTITTAWLHTFCWIFSALLALIRILLVVDFRLVKVKVELLGDIEKMLERNEEQLRTVSPMSTDVQNVEIDDDSTKVSYRNPAFQPGTYGVAQFSTSGSNTLYFSDRAPQPSALCLEHDEEMKLLNRGAYELLPKDEQFIAKALYDLLDAIDVSDNPVASPSWSIISETKITRQFGQELLASLLSVDIEPDVGSNEDENAPLIELKTAPDSTADAGPSSSKKTNHIAFESSLMNLSPEMKRKLKLNQPLQDSDEAEDDKAALTKKKSSLRKDDDKKTKQDKQVKISGSTEAFIRLRDDSDDTESKTADKSTQTVKPKQD